MSSITNYPIYRGKASGTKMQTLSISPYLNLDLFAKRLRMNVVYSYVSAQGLREELSNQARQQVITANLTYNNNKMGLVVNAFGFGMIGSDNTSLSYGINLQKSLNVPLIFKKKYRSISVNLFEDTNANGIRDAGEKGADQASVTINDKPYVAGKDGKISLLHTDTGRHEIVFNQTLNYSNLISVNGYKQTIDLQRKDAVVNIPLNKGQVINGKVTTVLDANSKNVFKIENIRITAVDTLGNTYTAFTDMEGGFSLNVPKGIYIVSINQAVFSEFFTPDLISQRVDVFSADERSILFVVRQKERKVNKVKASGF